VVEQKLTSKRSGKDVLLWRTL